MLGGWSFSIRPSCLNFSGCPTNAIGTRKLYGASRSERRQARNYICQLLRSCKQRARRSHRRRVSPARVRVASEQVIEATISRTAPWSFEPLEWNDALLGELLVPGVEPEVEPLPILPLAESLAQQHLELGDLLIISEFRRLRRNLDRRVVTVDVWTYDNGLRATVDSLLGR